MDMFNIYRTFWNYCFDNPENIKPNHIAIFSFAVEHCNRLGWKKKFGFPTSMVMEATGIKSYSVYKKNLDDLIRFDLIEIIEYSKNQWSSNIIALKENYKAHDKALDKAFVKHLSKQLSKHSESTCESTYQSTYESISSIIIQLNNKQINNITIDKILELKNSIDLYVSDFYESTDSIDLMKFHKGAKEDVISSIPEKFRCILKADWLANAYNDLINVQKINIEKEKLVEEAYHFINSCILNGDIHRTQPDFISHFRNKIKKEYKNIAHKEDNSAIVYKETKKKIEDLINAKNNED